MHTPEHVLTFVATAERWGMEAGQYWASTKFATEMTGPPGTTFFTEADLVQCHPYLAQVITKLMDEYAEINNATSISGFLVSRALRWLESPLVITSKSGTRMMLTDVEDIRPGPGNTVIIAAKCLLPSARRLDPLPGDTVSVFPGHYRGTRVAATVSELDATIPDWKARMATALDIGCTREEAANHALNIASLPAASLQTIPEDVDVTSNYG